MTAPLQSIKPTLAPNKQLVRSFYDELSYVYSGLEDGSVLTHFLTFTEIVKERVEEIDQLLEKYPNDFQLLKLRKAFTAASAKIRSYLSR